MRTTSPSRVLHEPEAQTGNKYEASPRLEARRRAIVIAAYLLSSSATTLIARRLAATSPNLRFRAQLLPSAGFALIAIISAVVQSLPNVFARFGIEASPGTKGFSAALLKKALPVSAVASAAALCAIEVPNWVAIETEQAIAFYAAPVVLLLAPLFMLSSSTDRLQFTTVGISAFLGYGLLSDSISPQGALLASGHALFDGVFLVLATKWLTSSTKLQFASAFAPMAALLSLLPTIAASSLLLPRSGAIQTLDSWVRTSAQPAVTNQSVWYIVFLAAFGIEQVSIMTALQMFSSPMHLALLALPRSLLIYLVTRHLYAQHHLGLAFVLGAGLWVWAEEEASPLNLWSAIRGSPASELPVAGKQDVQSESSRPASPVSSAAASRNAVRVMASLAPFAYFLIRALRGDQMSMADSFAMTTRVASRTGMPSLDLVFSYFDHDMDEFASHVDYMRKVPPVAQRDPRVIIYTKARPESMPEFAKQVGADEVYVLPNVGREGHTYLQHIIRNYGQSPDRSTGAGGLADQTAFCQDHLSWHGVAEERLKLLDTQTGYLHFAPYTVSDCGLDMENNMSFPRMKEIYTIFKEDICPPTFQLGAWSAQFFVSKKRILANKLSKYIRMNSIIEAPSGHWLHSSGENGAFEWGGEKYGPENPWIGHALERSWPVIFQCDDPQIARQCGLFDWDHSLCQCFDAS